MSGGGINLDLDGAERARRGASGILLGTVSEVDPATGLARVRSGDLLTGWLPWLSARAGGDRTWSAPDVGEQVLLAAPDGDLARGVILGALYRDAHPAPGSSQDLHTRVYADGAEISYDRASHTLTATLPAGGTVNLTSPGQVNVTSPQVAVTADTGVTVITPLMSVLGDLTVTGALSMGSGANGGGVIYGDLQQINGSFQTDGSVTSDGDQIAGAGAISQVGHVHGGVTPGGGTTGVPQ